MQVPGLEPPGRLLPGDASGVLLLDTCMQGQLHTQRYHVGQLEWVVGHGSYTLSTTMTAICMRRKLHTKWYDVGQMKQTDIYIKSIMQNGYT